MDMNDSFQKLVRDLHDSARGSHSSPNVTRTGLQVLRLQKNVENFRPNTIIVHSKQTLRDILIILGALSSRHIFIEKMTRLEAGDWTWS